MGQQLLRSFHHHRGTLHVNVIFSAANDQGSAAQPWLSESNRLLMPQTGRAQLLKSQHIRTQSRRIFKSLD